MAVTLVLKQTFQLLDQPPLCYKMAPICMAPPNHFLGFFQWIHTLITLRASKNAKRLWTACVLVPNMCIAIQDMRLFTCACGTWILATASIQEWQLFHSAHPEVWRQFKSGKLIESGVWSSKYGTLSAKWCSLTSRLAYHWQTGRSKRRSNAWKIQPTTQIP